MADMKKPVDPGFSKPGMMSASDLSKLQSAVVESPRPKGTQADHHVTDHTTHTQVVKPVPPVAEPARPMVGNDKAVAKKVKGPSWNNGYTN